MTVVANDLILVEPDGEVYSSVGILIQNFFWIFVTFPPNFHTFCSCCSTTQLCPTLQPHGLQHSRPSCSSQPPRVCPSSCSLHQWFCSSTSSSDTLFSFCPQSFPASGTFPVSCLFTLDDQNTGASVLALVLSVNIQGWAPLRLSGLITLLSKGLSGVFSSTTVRRHQLVGILPSLWSSYHNCTWPLGRP